MAPKTLQHKELRERTPRPPIVDHDTDPEPSSQVPSSQGEWWPIKEIIGEKARSYRVVWEGIDPHTGLPWKPEWIPRGAVTEDAKAEWDEKKRLKRSKRPTRKTKSEDPAGATPESNGIPNSDVYTSQTSEYEPTQKPQLELPSSATIAREPPSWELPTEIEDTFEASQVAPYNVIISRPRGFDAAQYISFSENSNRDIQDNRGDSVADLSSVRANTSPHLTAQLVVRAVPLNDTRVVPDSQDFGDSILSLESSAPLVEKPFLDEVSSSFPTPSEDTHYEDASQFLEDAQVIEVEAFESPPPSYEESISQPTDKSRSQVTKISDIESQFISISQESKEEDNRVVHKIGLRGPLENQLSFREPSIEERSSLEDHIEPKNQQTPGNQGITLVPATDPKEIYFGDEPVSVDRPSFSLDSQPERQPETPRSFATFISTLSSVDCSSLNSASEATGVAATGEQELEFSATSSREKYQRTKPSSTLLRGYIGTRKLRVSSEEPISNSRLGDWFKLNRRGQRVGSEPLPNQDTSSTRADLLRPLERIFPSSEFHILRKLLFSPKPMSQSSGSQMPRVPSAPPPGRAAQSLREMMAARKKLLDEKIAQRRMSSNSDDRPVTQSSSVIPQVASPIIEPASTPLKQLHSSSYSDRPVSAGANEQFISQSSFTFTSSSQTMFGSPKLGVAEYVVGLPLRTETIAVGALSQKKAYMDTLVSRHVDIERYLADPSGADTELVNRIQTTLISIGKIATHPSLPYDATKPSLDVPAEKQAEYDDVMSEKFHFLKTVLDAVRESSVRIAIVVEPGKLIDMLEIFLRGIMVQHTRLDKISLLPPVDEDSIQGNIKVLIVPSKGSGAVGNSCNVVIAMDPSFDADSYEIRQIRSNLFDPTKLAPVIHLVTINTVEHALFCLSKDVSEEEAMRATMEAVTILRLDAGVLGQNYQPYDNLLDRIVNWITTGCEGAPKIPGLPDMPLFEAATQTQPESRIEIEIEPNSPISNGEKRKRQDSLTQEPTTSSDTSVIKRVRVTDDIDPVQIDKSDGDHLVASQSPIVAMETQEAVFEPAVSETVQSSEGLQITRSLAGIESSEDIEVVFVQSPTTAERNNLHTSTKEELLSVLQKQQSDFDVWKESTSRLQKRHEELKKTLQEVKAELQQYQRAEALALARRDRALNEVAKLGAQNTELGTELDAAVTRLRGGPPEKAAMQQALDVNAELKAKLQAANVKVESTEREAEFAREQYQKASNAIFEMRKEMEELQRRNEDLERKADVRTVKLRQLQNENAVAERDDLIEELKIRLKERDERIAKLEQEKANPRSRGAWGTRSVSVPRRGSPVQSRASSPALAALTLSPGSTGHPLRNASG